MNTACVLPLFIITVTALYSNKVYGACPDACTQQYDPVCGSDGKTYSNACMLAITACKSKPNLRVIHKGNCNVCAGHQCRSPVHSKCRVVNDKPTCSCVYGCPRMYRPVCGSDGKTHANKCLLEQVSCRRNRAITIIKHGPCNVCAGHQCRSPVHSKCRVVRGKPTCSCVYGCPRMYRPVCGSDGKTYANKCLLEQVSCRRNRAITIIKHGPCTSKVTCVVPCRWPATCKRLLGRARCVRSCPRFCSRLPRLVCASDGKTYRNECEMKRSACRINKKLTVRYRRPCKPTRPTSCRCPRPQVCQIVYGRPTCVTRLCPSICPRLYRPVCGTDGNTYSNRCALQRRSCATHKDIKIAYPRKCKGGPSSACKRLRCRPPLTICKVIHGRGRCVRDPNCPVRCPRTSYRPVCGSDGRTYPNECILKRIKCTVAAKRDLRKIGDGRCKVATSCRNFRCFRKPYSKCMIVNNRPTCECEAKERCPRISSPVCGTDGKTYRNVCFLKVAACTTIKYIRVAQAKPCTGVGSCRNTRCLSRPYSTCRVIKNKPTCVCPRMCRKIMSPVCGSNGVTYPNMCMLKINSCNTKRMIRVFKRGRCSSVGVCDNTTCTSPPHSICRVVANKPKCVCPRICPLLLLPVCGSDGKTYVNACQLKVAACNTNNNITVKSLFRCHASITLLDEMNCWKICGTEEPNPCHVVNCGYYSTCQVINNKTTCVCPTTACRRTYKPVCSTDGKTYVNRCFLERDSCKRKVVVRVAKVGECPGTCQIRSLCKSPANSFCGVTKTGVIRCIARRQ